MERINDIDTIIENADRYLFRRASTKAETCRLLGVSRPTLDRIIRVGKIQKPYDMWVICIALKSIKRGYECSVEEKFR